MLEGVVGGIVQKKKALEERIRNYISTQRQHINDEEGNVYPAIESKLQSVDWAKLEKELTWIEDPVFGKTPIQAYQSLYKQILSA